MTKSNKIVGFLDTEYGSYSEHRYSTYKQILKYNQIEYIDLNLSDPEFWEIIKNLDLFLYRYAHIDNHQQIAATILPIIENHLNIKCFPAQNTCWHFDDKIKQYLLLKSYGFPFVESWIFWSKNVSLSFAKNVDYPIIFKLKGGAGSLNVIKVDNYRQAKFLIKNIFGTGIKSGKIPGFKGVQFHNLKSFIRNKLASLYYRFKQPNNETWIKHKNYIYFQKYLPKNEFDIRITTIGNRAFGFRRFVRSNDFRASGSGSIDHSSENIDLRCVEIALKISEKMKFQTMAYDFIYDELGNPKLCEISYTYADWVIHQCPGYWDEKLNWIEGHYWPQYFHLMDALNIKILKQPEIDAYIKNKKIFGL